MHNKVLFFFPIAGAQVDRQYSTERKRRYSDSAHITVDSPSTELSPTLRSKSLDDLRKLYPEIRSNSSGQWISCSSSALRVCLSLRCQTSLIPFIAEGCGMNYNFCRSIGF